MLTRRRRRRGRTDAGGHSRPAHDLAYRHELQTEANVLTYLLAHSDPAYFRPLSASSTSSNQKALTENWVLRFNNLKRLYKLLIRYFECVRSYPRTCLY